MEKKSLRLLMAISLFCFAFAVAGASASWAANASKMTPGKATMAPVTAKKQTPSDQTMAVQKALNKEGYKLKDDGLMGKHTRAAIRSFQKKNGLKATGTPDEETLAKLGIK
jgi:peptidoglycan hydrolase-like protein with peptidoglycan-binding domain